MLPIDLRNLPPRFGLLFRFVEILMPLDRNPRYGVDHLQLDLPRILKDIQPALMVGPPSHVLGVHF